MDSFQIFLIVICFATFVFEGVILTNQLKQKEITMKNHRYFLHINLLVLTVVLFFRFLDTQIINYNSLVEGGREIDPQWGEVDRNYCKYSGSLQVFLEGFALCNFCAYLHVLRKSVTQATSNVKSEIVKSVGLALLIPLIVLIAFLVGPHIGLESSGSCGISYNKSFTEYTELLRSWILIFVPLLNYQALNLTRNVPGFVRESFDFYKS